MDDVKGSWRRSDEVTSFFLASGDGGVLVVVAFVRGDGGGDGACC